ncbi:MAG: slipin family protein [Chloroflexi bacterium]|jgi:regulator of protease activity HflC (stomatin/prohibitin superfamily)|nr:slipin family protein [Chloroflexota bacterium]MBT7081202.1 slipin family protein [Chloroflexota bacterium]MBT7290257.1 slipin family protein [Chloroflexota bacterium]
MNPAIWIVVIIVLALLMLVPQAVRVVKEYERAVILRLGRYVGTRGPGWVWLIPFLERPAIVDLRTITLDVPTQEAITKDNVTIRANAVVFFRVLEPEKAVLEVEDYIRATSQIAQTTLRSIVGQSDLDEVLANREKINQTLAKIIDESTDPWGVKVSVVEMKEIELPETMKRAMAAQAEAEREKRAKLIHADGEFAASKKLAEAGKVIAQEPIALQLRYLSTLTEVATEKNSTLIFPIPIDLISTFMSYMKKDSGGK